MAASAVTASPPCWPAQAGRAQPQRREQRFRGGHAVSRGHRRLFVTPRQNVIKAHYENAVAAGVEVGLDSAGESADRDGC